MLRFMGDNGKPNDNMLMHILSPYAKHPKRADDCQKLTGSGFELPYALLIYGYDHDDWPMEPAVEAFDSSLDTGYSWGHDSSRASMALSIRYISGWSLRLGDFVSRLDTARVRYYGAREARPARTTMLRPGDDGSQLDRQVRPVLGEPPSSARAGRARGSRGDSNSGPLPEVVLGGRCYGCLTCGSLAPLTTAR
jgi:hypothetical protein